VVAVALRTTTSIGVERRDNPFLNGGGR